MPMPVMGVREMNMAVCHRIMSMRVAVFRAQLNREIMCMLVVLIMPVFMCVLERLMRVRMLVALGHVQPQTQGHE